MVQDMRYNEEKVRETEERRMPDNIQYLKNIPIFADLAEEQLLRIHNYTTERYFPRDTAIFFEGEPGEGFHYLKSGRVKIVKTSADGREHIIKILNKGEIFAEVLLFGNYPYPATAIAVENSHIGVIRNADLEQLVLKNNLLALHLIKALSQRLLYTQQKIKNLALHDVVARTAETLVRLSREQGIKNADSTIEISLHLSRQELADLVGTTRETVTRTLSKLKKEEVIAFEGHKIKILKLNHLERLII